MNIYIILLIVISAATLLTFIASLIGKKKQKIIVLFYIILSFCYLIVGSKVSAEVIQNTSSNNKGIGVGVFLTFYIIYLSVPLSALVGLVYFFKKKTYRMDFLRSFIASLLIIGFWIFFKSNSVI